MGLLRPSATTAGGYRLFDERCVERLKLIKACRDAQINLAEIAEFVRGMGMAATSNSASAWSFARAGSGVSLPRRLPDQCRLLPSVQWRFVPAEPRDRGTCAQSECALGRDRERRRVLTLLRIEMRPLVQVCDGSQECFLLIDAMSSGAQVTAHHRYRTQPSQGTAAQLVVDKRSATAARPRSFTGDQCADSWPSAPGLRNATSSAVQSPRDAPTVCNGAGGHRPSGRYRVMARSRSGVKP